MKTILFLLCLCVAGCAAEKAKTTAQLDKEFQNYLAKKKPLPKLTPPPTPLWPTQKVVRFPLPPRPPESLPKAVTKSKASPVLKSPRHASITKAARMSRSISEPPYLPMKAFHTNVVSDFGNQLFTAQALQPAGQSILFEVASILDPTYYIPLGGAGPFPYPQQVQAGLYTYEQMLFIRCKATPETPAAFGPAAMTGTIWINPAMRAPFFRVIPK